jgi:hypothetical protein
MCALTFSSVADINDPVTRPEAPLGKRRSAWIQRSTPGEESLARADVTSAGSSPAKKRSMLTA